MKHRFTMAAIPLILLAVFVFSGCSDDATDPTQITGDPNSTEFQPTKAAIACALDSTLALLAKFVDDPVIYPVDSMNIRTELGARTPDDSATYGYLNGWHVVFLGLQSGIDYNFTFVDSARYLQGGSSVREYTWRVDKVDYIRHQTNIYKGTNSSYQNFNAYVDLEMTDMVSSFPELDGQGTFLIDDYYAHVGDPVHDIYDFDFEVKDVKIRFNFNRPWQELIVEDGTITMNAQFSGSVTRNWTVTATFDDQGHADIHAVTGNTVYDYSHTPEYQ